jgi:hypothetical protein
VCRPPQSCSRSRTSKKLLFSAVIKIHLEYHKAPRVPIYHADQRVLRPLCVSLYQSCSRSRTFKKLLFSAAFFNALILERRKFGAVGWNIPYEWMNSDLKAAVMQVNSVRLYMPHQVIRSIETICIYAAPSHSKYRDFCTYAAPSHLQVRRRGVEHPLRVAGLRPQGRCHAGGFVRLCAASTHSEYRGIWIYAAPSH